MYQNSIIYKSSHAVNPDLDWFLLCVKAIECRTWSLIMLIADQANKFDSLRMDS
jgi:hypothetical protein